MKHLCKREGCVNPAAKERPYCSWECYLLDKGVKVDRYTFKCARCKKEKTVILSKYKGNLPKYCSRECLYKAKRKRVIVSCLLCGKKKERLKSYVEKGLYKFCSKECFEKNRKVERSHIHCQNPTCRNAIWHYHIFTRGGKQYKDYHPQQKYCSRKCANSMERSDETKEKHRLSLADTLRKKKWDNKTPQAVYDLRSVVGDVDCPLIIYD